MDVFKVEEPIMDNGGEELKDIKQEEIFEQLENTSNILFTSDDSFDQKYDTQFKREHGEASDTTQALNSRLSVRIVDKLLDQAVEEIRKGGSLSVVAAYYRLSEDLIYQSLVSRNVTHQMDILTKHEETSLVKWILRSNKNNSIVMKQQLLEKVGKMKKVSRITPIFARSKYGRMWYQYFLRSNPEIFEDDGVLLVSASDVQKETPKNLVPLNELKQAAIILHDFRKQKNFLSTLKDKVILPADLREDVFNVEIKSEEPQEDFENPYTQLTEDTSFFGFEDIKNSPSDDDTSISEIEEKKNPIFNTMNFSNILKSARKKVNKREVVDLKSTCEECQKSFCNKAKLQRHMFTHVPKELYTVSCYKCLKRFPSKYHFLVHLKITHSDKTHTCRDCGKVFKHQTSLSNHFRREHCTNKETDNSRRFVCDICKKSFKYKNSLEAHIMYGHLKENKRHICSICNKGFIKRSAMLRHKTRHSKTKPLMCTHCTKSFSRKYILTGHMEKCGKEKNKEIDEECQQLCQEFMEEIILD